MIPPIAGVIITDYHFVKKTEFDNKSFDWVGISSWLGGVSIVFLFESDIKNILGIVVSGFLYSILNLILKKRP
jgi:purine-cytosine permease-like protein